jgi:hypothetical protein
MKARAKKTKSIYRWWPDGKDRFDLVAMGEPDCHAYIIRYWSERWKSSAWCWILTMPRAGGNQHRGFARAAHTAKREVEAAIREHWR